MYQVGQDIPVASLFLSLKDPGHDVLDAFFFFLGLGGAQASNRAGFKCVLLCLSIKI